MNRKKYNQIRAAVAVFVAVIVAVAVSLDSYVLSAVGVTTGMIFTILVRTKARITVDEREKTIREKAANLTYAIFAPTIGIGAFILLIPYRKISPAFGNANFVYLQSLGMVLAYLTFFLILVYSVSYYLLNRKYGGGSDAE